MKGYEELFEEIEKKSKTTKNVDDFMAYICKFLHDEIPYYDWVGFYILKKGKLYLGHYVGRPTEHKQIDIGVGVCGRSAQTLRPVLVPDVTNEENYLACSAETRSEIVVPIMLDKDFWGEIDIDSDTINAFSNKDRLFLENIAKLVIKLLKS